MKRLTFYGSGLRDFLRFRFQPSMDLLIVLISFLILVAGIYATRSSFPIASVWFPVSMFILGILVPIAYNSLVKKRPLSEMGISKKYWKKSLVLSTILGAMIVLPAVIKGPLGEGAITPLTFTGLLPLLALEIIAGLFYAVFFHGWIQMRFERAFGAIPAILIAAAFFALHHVAYGEPVSLLYMGHLMGGLIHATVFRITRNILILWPFFVSTTGLIYDIGWGLRLPFEAIYGYIGVLVLMWLFIAVVHWKQKKRGA
ncbi:MAG TPA: CPBP family glutamic-type intramembrane protease [archaeon]|nr:CPBP family glutamic-type intramembrane protease [archaeon]